MVSCVSCIGKLSFANLDSPLYKAMLVLKLNDLNCKKIIYHFRHIETHGMSNIVNTCPPPLKNAERNIKMFPYYSIFTLSFKAFPYQSVNFDILVDNIPCSRYNKDGNRGPSYSCNKIGQNVTIRRYGSGNSVLSVCNIKVYQGEYCIFTYHLFYFF